MRENLNPLDRYLFLYFLTNDKTSICGVYELPMSIISSETGLEREMILKMLKRLKNKVDYIEGWIAIKNFQKYQNTNSPKIKAGIEAEMKKIPQNVLTKIPYLYPMDTISHLNTNSNLNLNTNSNTNSFTPNGVVDKTFCSKAPLKRHNMAGGKCSWCDAPQETGRKFKGVRELRSIN